ncbi:MAG: FAD-dependent oxidoreductase [Floccifex porci]|uniref:oxidoreductase n=1 Tax=Floccifex porci TaxID=2606629 RepID=UPI003F0A35E9
MSIQYKELFQPFQIGRVEIKNRICMSAMHPEGWMDEHGILTDTAIRYYEERAKGGTGLIFTGALQPVTQFEGAGVVNSPFAAPGKFISQYRKLADRIHAYGGKVFIQIAYGGGRVTFPGGLSGVPIAASEGPNRWDDKIRHRMLTTEEVRNIIKDTIDAVRICRMTGCDGVDINAYGGYLFDEFLTDAFNHRTDEFGGSLEAKLKILTDIITAVKKEDHFFPITCRIGTKHHVKEVRQGTIAGEEYAEFGRDIPETIEMAQILETAGYDAFYIGNGCYDSFYWMYPPMYQPEGLWFDDVKEFTKQVTVPVICGGKVLQPEMANVAVREGKVTAVALGRALLADADWAYKAKMGEDEKIRPCIGCNVGCLGNIFSGLPMQCAVNPDLFCEEQSEIKKAVTCKKVTIIGAGIAGLECARVAAKRGHQVEIFDKANMIGGVFHAAGVPEFKKADHRLISWYARELDEAGVKVHLEKEITLEELKAMDADEIVVATGAKAKIPPIEGIQQDNVITGVEALNRIKEIGEKVIVIGGGQVGCEIAIWLKDNGKDVKIVEFAPKLMSGMGKPFEANSLQLEDTLAYKNVEVLLNTGCKKIDGNKVTVAGLEGERVLEADTIILSIGFNPDMKFFHEIDLEMSKKVWCLGDAKQPTNILYAIKDGNAVGRAI